MKTLGQQLAAYAAYHRDRRNVATHLVGIPMIVVAVATLLSRPATELAGWRLTPAMAVAALLLFYYLRLDRRLGLVMAALFGLALWAGDLIARQPLALWLSWGVGLLAVGWICQFVGHIFEGRKPAFFDDVMGLAIGPLFVVAEAGFRLGLGRDLRRRIDLSSATARN